MGSLVNVFVGVRFDGEPQLRYSWWGLLTFHFFWEGRVEDGWVLQSLLRCYFAIGEGFSDFSDPMVATSLRERGGEEPVGYS
ncbi:MAG TPA: hypothetical protein PLM33_13430 [Acidobacteriota bacterium]|nr:hypothetical protein [Acidobacteriota bacterium]HRV07688.1 hypothetical protein [Acidobacteriota bacterium]